MADDVLKGFLVSLGFKVNEAGQKKFKEVMQSAVVQANLLASAIEATAVAVTKSLFGMSESFDKLYFASKRTGASAQNIKALSYAFTQVGGSSEEASGAIESFARAMRTNPGVGGFVRSLGVATHEGGKARETFTVLSEAIGKIQARNPHFAGAQLASILGLDEHQYLLMTKSIDEVRKYREEYDKTSRMMGLNNQEAAESHNKLSTSMRSLSMIVSVAGEKILTLLAPAIEKIVKSFVKWIDSHPEEVAAIFNKIKEAAEWLGEKLIWLSKQALEMTKDGSFVKMWDDAIQKVEKLVDALDKVVKFLIWVDDFGSKSNKPIGQAVTGILGNGPNETSSWVPNWAKKGWNGVKRVFSGGVANAGEGGVGAPAGTGAAAGSGSTPRGNGMGTAGRARMGEMMSYAMDQLRREGVPEGNLRQAAAHLVGQAYMESTLNPNLVHDGGTGYGIYGARDPGGKARPRRTLMLNWLAANGYAKNSAEGQMRYMAIEAMSKHYPETRRILMGQGSGNVSADAMRITKTFEAPLVANDRSGAVRNAMQAGPEVIQPKKPVAPLNLPKMPTGAFSPGQGGFDVNAAIKPAAPMGATSTTNNNGNTNNVNVSTTNNVRIDGAPDPASSARQTERALNRSSAISLRNMQHAIG